MRHSTSIRLAIHTDAGPMSVFILSEFTERERLRRKSITRPFAKVAAIAALNTVQSHIE